MGLQARPTLLLNLFLKVYTACYCIYRGVLLDLRIRSLRGYILCHDLNVFSNTTWQKLSLSILLHLVMFEVRFFLKDFIYLFLEREERREKERERNNSRLPLTHPLLGTWPATQACALTGNQTGDLLVRRLALNPLSHASRGSCLSI